MRIGEIELPSNVLLAPIAGYCDLAYRLVVRSLGGVGMAYTDLVNPRGLKEKTARSMQIVRTLPADQPLGIQLYGTSASELAEAARWCADHGATIIDINMGCPVAKVAGKGGGSGLLRSCPDAARLAEAVVRASPVPVTVKTRLGWEMGRLVAPALARQFHDGGVAALTIHGRYGEQAFRGECDWDGIAQVVAASGSMPVFGNGDIRAPEDAARMIRQTGCAGVMIGRWALADPWILRATQAFLRDGMRLSPPSVFERLDKIVEHFENMRQFLGDRLAVTQFRKRMSWYAKVIGPCPDLRRKMPMLESIEQFYGLLGEFRDNLKHSQEQDRLEPAVA